MRILIILITLIFAELGCRQGMKEVKVFERDIPDFKKGSSPMLEGLKGSRDALGLDTLENGYDSLEIRLWITYKVDTFQIISIKNRNNEWKGSYCETALHFNLRRDTVLSYSKSERPIFPKLPWQTLIDSLVKLKILTLPDCTKIKGYDFPFEGGNSITFESSTLRKYRLYMYQLPGTIKNVSKEAADVDNILRLISVQFDIQYLDSF